MPTYAIALHYQQDQTRFLWVLVNPGAPPQLQALKRFAGAMSGPTAETWPEMRARVIVELDEEFKSDITDLAPGPGTPL